MNRILQLRYSYSDVIDEVRARGLLLLSTVVGFLTGLAFLYTLLTASGAISILLAMGVGMISSILTAVLIQRGRISIASGLYVGAILVVATLYLIPYGVNNVAALILVMPLTLGGALLDRTGVIAVLLTTIAVAIALALIHHFNVIPLVPYQADPSEIVDLIIGIVVSFLALAAVSWMFSVRQANLAQNVSKSANDLRTVIAIGQKMNELGTPDELLRDTIESVRDQLGYFHVQIFLVEEGSGLVVRRASTAASRATASRRLTLSETGNIVVDAIRTGKTIRITTESPRSFQSEFVSATRVEALVPLRRADHVLGVLDVHSSETGSLSGFALDVLESIGAQFSNTLQNLQRSLELETTAADRRELQEQTIHLTRELDRLSQEVAGRAWSRYLAGRSQSTIGFDWIQGQLAASDAMPASLAKTYENAMPDMKTEGNDQIMGIPILLRGQRLGVMEFRTPLDRPWDAQSIELARIITQRLALTLENIRLYEQAQYIASREQTISRVAAELQSQTDLNALLEKAAETFSQALGATRTSVQLALSVKQRDGS